MQEKSASFFKLGLFGSIALKAKMLVEDSAKIHVGFSIIKLEKCLFFIFSVLLFFTVYNFFSYTLQYSEAYEFVALPQEGKAEEPKSNPAYSSAIPAMPEASCHPNCDPAFLRKYSQKLGFNLSCDVSKGLILAASKWLGKPHTAKVGEEGIDCSGFVRNVFKDAYNTTLNVCAADMYTKYSKPISRKQLRHGDLVFFNTKGDAITHVGIYLQDDKFIHTSYSSGVRVSSLDDKYYAQRFYAAGRIL